MSRLPHALHRWLTQRPIGKALERAPDFVIGGNDNPYLRRWFIVPRNRIFNVYVHQFLRSDDDRALHCHPWANLSVLLQGGYLEHTIAAGGIERKELLWAGDCRFRRSGKMAHRIELMNGAHGLKPCWTLFITGPRYRSWGFHCPQRGWVRWDEFTAPEDSGGVGKGCNA